MGRIIEDPKLRHKRYTFEDRTEAGRVLAQSLEAYRGTRAIVLAIPSGGIPVATEIAKELDLQMDIVVVRKLQIPFNPEAGFGAVALTGETIMNEGLLAEIGLTDAEIGEAREKALEAARSRDHALRGSRPFPSLNDRTVILVDDGLASGYTMLAAINRVKTDLPNKIVVAVPTGSETTVEMVAQEVDETYCLNIRGVPFAVADAYRNWYDLTEDEAVRVLRTVL